MAFSDNPYKLRKPVTNPAYFCGRRKELLFLAERIKDQQMCAVSGEPLVGKTSLLYYLVHPEGAWTQQAFRDYLGDPGRYLFVLVEPWRVPLDTASTFFRYFLDRTVEELEKVDGEIADQVRRVHAQKPSDDYEMQRLLEFILKRQERQIVLLCDDFDSIVTSLHNDELVKVIQRLRALNHAQDLQGRFTCVFFSTDPLEHLFKAKAFTISNSPLSRVKIDHQFLKMIGEDEVRDYIKKPLPPTFQFSDGDIEEIRDLAGCHPELIKITCYHMYQTRRDKRSGTGVQMRETLEKDPNAGTVMNMIWQRVARDDTKELPLKRSFVEVAQRDSITSSNQTAVEELAKRGLIEDESASGAWILGRVFCQFLMQKAAETGAQKPGETELLGYSLRMQLAPLEFKLFCYLAEHVEQTCGRAELQNAIWGDRVPYSPDDALEQLIKRIREKLEPHPQYPQLLLTVRGQGYLLKSKSTI